MNRTPVPTLFATAILSCLLSAASGVMAADTEVMGVHVVREAQSDSTVKTYSALGCGFASALGPMHVEEYFAVIGGQPVHAEYMTKNIVERIPAPPTSLCPFTTRAVEEIFLTHYGKKKRYTYSSDKGKWGTHDLPGLAGAKFTFGAFGSMAAARGHAFTPGGWDKVAGVRCRISAMSLEGHAIETCVADEKALKEAGLNFSFPKQLDMRSVHKHKDGADANEVVSIDFKAKIPLSRLYPPKLAPEAPLRKPGGSAHDRWCAAEAKRTGINPCQDDPDDDEN